MTPANEIKDPKIKRIREQVMLTSEDYDPLVEFAKTLKTNEE